MDLRQAQAALSEARTELSKKVSLYPYRSFENVGFLNKLLAAQQTDFQQFVANKRILDIGCADGDMAFLCEMLGAKEVAAIDWADTNYNFMQGVRALRDHLRSKIHIFSGNVEDMDLSFLGIWNAILFLGTLYHLPNPIRVLRKLSVVAPQIFCSTRVLDVLPGEKGVSVAGARIGYLLNPAESNNDATNWWTLTGEAVKTMFERSGWRVSSSFRIDQLVGRADPVDPEKDGRIFLMARSMYL